MALFSLGSGVVVKQQVPYGVKQAFRLAEELISDYQNQGLKVELRESREGEKLVAGISNREGTKLQVQVELNSLEDGSAVSVSLTGKVHVGGMQAMFASDSKVRKIAKERMIALLKKIFDPRRTPVEAISEPIEAEPEVEKHSASQEASEPNPEKATPIVEDGHKSEEAQKATELSGEPDAEAPSAEDVADEDVTTEEPATEQSEAVEPAEAPEDIPESVPLVEDQPVPAEPQAQAVAENTKSSAVTVNVAGRSLEERLTMLKLMLDRGLITNDDFKWKKNELLASI